MSSSVLDHQERTCEANPAAENSSFILKVHVKSVPLYHLNPIPGGGGGYGKFAYPSADRIFRIEEKFFTAPFFFTFNIF